MYMGTLKCLNYFSVFTLNFIIDFLTPVVLYFKVTSMHGSQLIVKEKKKLITFVFHETEGSSPKTPTRLKKFKNDEALRKQRLLIKNIQVWPHNQAPYNFRT